MLAFLRCFRQCGKTEETMEKSVSKTRWHIYFSGRVQRVGFRYTASRLAKNLSLTGWVANLPDDRVEMEVQGAVSQLRKLIIQLKAQPYIHIEHMEITEIDVKPSEHTFAVTGY